MWGRLLRGAKRLRPKRRFDQDHFEQTGRGGSPEEEVRFKTFEYRNSIFLKYTDHRRVFNVLDFQKCLYMRFQFLDMVHTNFSSSIKKKKNRISVRKYGFQINKNDF